MEAFFSRAAESAPEFIALIVLVGIFLRALWVIIQKFMDYITLQEQQFIDRFSKHSHEQEKLFIDHINKKDEQFEKIAREMAEFMDASTKTTLSAIERNTAVLEHVKIRLESSRAKNANQ